MIDRACEIHLGNEKSCHTNMEYSWIVIMMNYFGSLAAPAALWVLGPKHSSHLSKRFQSL